MREMTMAEFKKLGKNMNNRVKYHNKPTEYRNRTYPSIKEAGHACRLDIAKSAMFPSERVLFYYPQLPITFACGTKMLVDFLVLYADGHYELHEVKGGDATKTAAYKIKKKLLKNEYSLEVMEK